MHAESSATAEATPSLLVNLTHIAGLQNRHGDAAQLARNTLTVALEQGDTFTAAAAVMHIAWLLATQGDPERAARLLGSAIGFHERAGATLQRTERVCERRAREALRDQFDAPTLQALLDEGRAMALDAAVRDALRDSRPPFGGARGLMTTPIAIRTGGNEKGNDGTSERRFVLQLQHDLSDRGRTR